MISFYFMVGGDELLVSLSRFDIAYLYSFGVCIRYFFFPVEYRFISIYMLVVEGFSLGRTGFLVEQRSIYLDVVDERFCVATTIPLGYKLAKNKVLVRYIVTYWIYLSLYILTAL